MDGRLESGDAEGIWQGAALDSRRVGGGELFFALAGERTDGHRFVADALRRGAAGAVVSAPVEGSSAATLIEVDDTYRALHRLTRHVRRTVPQHLVAITGSAGKTTTKELLAKLLAVRYRVAASPGNLNNTYGFPIALLGIADDTEWMVAEMGMSTPGELAAIARLGRPEVAVFTNVRAAHLEHFESAGREPSVLAIAEAKAELLEGLGEGALVVANAGDPQVVRIARRYRRGRVRWWALRPETVEGLSLWADEVEPLGGEEVGSRFVAATDTGERAEVRLRLHGEVNVENFLAAATCALALDLSLEEIAAAAAEVAAAPGRGELHRLAAGARLVDDSYNSSPDALAHALRAARELPAGRHWAVLGSMLELGSASGRLHRQAGELAARLGFSPVVGVAEECRELVRAAAEAGAQVEWFPDAEGAAGWAIEAVAPDDVILVKGSRGVGLERVVVALRAVPNGEEG